MRLPMSASQGDCRLEVDFAARRVTVNGRGVSLTPTEFDILALLAERAGSVVSLDTIIDRIWGDWFGPRNHVSVHIHHLRRKLGPCGDLVVTRRSRGYLLDVRGSGAVSDAGLRDGRVSTLFLALLEEENGADDVIWLLGGRDGRISWVSTSVTEILGWPVDALLGRPAADFVNADDVGIGLLADGHPHGIVGPVTARVLRLDGSEVAIESVARVFRDDNGAYDGSLSRWQLVAGDVTDVDGST